MIRLARGRTGEAGNVLITYLPYIPKYKSRIFAGFYKDKVGGSTYIRVYAPQKKITSEIPILEFFLKLKSHM